MTSRRSAGILLHRECGAGTEVLLVHPGGPFWARRDEGAWQLPKGVVEPDEDDETAARRETREELGVAVDVPLVPLGEVKQSRGKTVVAFAARMDFDPADLVSNTAEIEWPPRSGTMITIPEIDEARWFGLERARTMMLSSQTPLLDRLVERLAIEGR